MWPLPTTRWRLSDQPAFYSAGLLCWKALNHTEHWIYNTRVDVASSIASKRRLSVPVYIVPRSKNTLNRGDIWLQCSPGRVSHDYFTHRTRVVRHRHGVKMADSEYNTVEVFSKLAMACSTLERTNARDTLLKVEY